MPDTIQFGNGNQIINRYTADGRKLGTEYFTRLVQTSIPIDNNIVCSWTYAPGITDQKGKAYIGNIDYSTYFGNTSYTSVNCVHNAEGYAKLPGYFCYFRKDHLGNNREVWQANTNKTIQYTQYYPSGLPWTSNTSDKPAVQAYKYNGKEFVEMHGYDTYDYGARGYYPAIGRFTSVDPLAEDDPSVSPYAYCRNNPINRIDPDGMKDIPLPEVVVVAPKPKNTVVETHAITIPLYFPMVYSLPFVQQVLPLFFIFNTIGSDTNRYSASSKNSPHANQKAKDSAEQEYNKVEQEYDNLKSKPNKTPDDKNKLEKLKRALKRLKDKMDFKGENHSRNAKGNR